jgi:hypothetical protein
MRNHQMRPIATMETQHLHVLKQPNSYMRPIKKKCDDKFDKG